jgi:hypothetical protein
MYDECSCFFDGSPTQLSPGGRMSKADDIFEGRYADPPEYRRTVVQQGQCSMDLRDYAKSLEAKLEAAEIKLSAWECTAEEMSMMGGVLALRKEVDARVVKNSLPIPAQVF